MKIGEIMAADREITLNEGKKTVTVTVANKGDRPVQVGSHFHFFETVIRLLIPDKFFPAVQQTITNYICI